MYRLIYFLVGLVVLIPLSLVVVVLSLAAAVEIIGTAAVSLARRALTPTEDPKP